MVLLCTFLICGGLYSQTLPEDELENRVREIAHELRCPTCQGLSVKESEAGLSVNMKSKIRSMLKEGKSEEEILRFFEERYGEWILRNPKKSGFNLLLWGLPGVIILLAAGLLLFNLQKRSLRMKTETHTHVPLSDKEKSVFDQDFDQLMDDE